MGVLGIVRGSHHLVNHEMARTVRESRQVVIAVDRSLSLDSTEHSSARLMGRGIFVARAVGDEMHAQAMERLGLNKPLYAQYLDYVGKAVKTEIKG